MKLRNYVFRMQITRFQCHLSFFRPTFPVCLSFSSCLSIFVCLSLLVCLSIYLCLYVSMLSFLSVCKPFSACMSIFVCLSFLSVCLSYLSTTFSRLTDLTAFDFSKRGFGNRFPSIPKFSLCTTGVQGGSPSTSARDSPRSPSPQTSNIVQL